MDLTTLWLPIVLAAVGVFLVSAIVWMALPLHRKEYRKHERSEEVAEWIRRNQPAVGRYMIGWHPPGEDRKAAPATATSPRALLLVDYGPPNMGKSLGLWFVNLLVVSVLIGYVASVALPRGAAAIEVARVTFTAGLLAYGGGALPKAIWEGIPWSHVPAALVDALLYAAATAAVFAISWPA